MAAPDEDLLSVLLDQHRQIRELLTRVSEDRGTPRAEAFGALVRLLAVHEAAEEQVLHPVARMRLPDGDRVADARIDEEEESKRLLAELERVGPDDDDFDRRFAQLRELVLLHAANEENEEFPGLREHYDDEDLRALGHALRAAEALAPTHPHPGDPDTPPGNLLIGPVTGLADRAKDLLRAAVDRARHRS